MASISKAKRQTASPPSALSNGRAKNILASSYSGAGLPRPSDPLKPILKARAMDYLPISPPEKGVGVGGGGRKGKEGEVVNYSFDCVSVGL